MKSVPLFLKNAEKKQINGSASTCYFFSKNDASIFFRDLLDVEQARHLRLKALSSSSRPNILLMVFESEGNEDWIHVEVDCASLSSVPSLRELWPVASWWEHELERNSSFRFSSENRLEGVKWRL